MAILTVDDVIAGMSVPLPMQKSSATSKGAGSFHSLWKVAGLPGAGNNPPLFSAGSGYVPDKTTLGAMRFPNPNAGEETKVAKLSLAGATPGLWILYDRVWACSGFNTTVTTAQAITTPGDAGRYNNFDGVEIWGEIYAAPGATAATWTVSYTSSDGVAGRTATYAHPASAEVVGQMVPFTLQAGDRGVQNVQSLTCSVSSGTAGDVGITLVRRLLGAPLNANGFLADGLTLGLPRLLPGACLAAMVLCSAATTGVIVGDFSTAQR